MENILKKLSIAFYWHMHQPVYELDSVYLMPWARLHAVKDYLDMLLILEKHPKIKLNFNVVPALMDMVIDYSKNGFHDIHSSLTVTPVEQLADAEKEYILNNFFSAEYETMILHHPIYRKLFKKRFAKKEININNFSNQEYSDLLAIFNLAWIDPTHLNRFPELRQLAAKEKGFTLKDRIKIIELHRKIMSRIVPTYKEYVHQGRIELTTSPYYHPILPILCDVSSTVNSEEIDISEDMNLSDDAYNQIKKAIDKVEEIFEIKPKGIWAPEHCLTPKVLDMLSDLGIKWTVSDESILSKTMNTEFLRDFKGNLEDPYHLLKVYNYQNKTDNKSIDLIFRDSSISNLINFEYPNIDSQVAAEDLYNKIKLTQNKLLVSPDNNHLLTIAQDGENCWERYKSDGGDFLNHLYKLIEKDNSLETVLISDYIEEDNSKKKIDNIYPGSWTNTDFMCWIGEPIKNLAWKYLTTVRNDILNFAGDYSPEIINEAMNEIYIAEGSDWFWWFGEPNNSGQDNIFDFLFREHLKKVYKILGIGYPEFLDKSIFNYIVEMTKENVEQDIPEYNDIKYINSFTFPDGPVYMGGKLYDSIEYGYDSDNVYFRLHLKPNYKNENEHRPAISNFMIYFSKNSKIKTSSGVRVAQSKMSKLNVLNKKYNHEFCLTFVGNNMYPPTFSTAIDGNLWEINDFSDVSAPNKDTIDIKISFDDLEIKKGQKLSLFFIIAKNHTSKFVLPKDSLLEIIRLR